MRRVRFLTIVTGLGLVLTSIPANRIALGGPIPPLPPGAPPVSEPLPPDPPPLGVPFLDPPALSSTELWIPGGNLHEFDVSCGPGVAFPPPPTIIVLQDLAGADQAHFRLDLASMAGGFSAYVIFGASPWGTPPPGGSGVGYVSLVTPLSPFWTTPRYDSPLGPTPPGTFAFNVVCVGPDGLVAGVSDPVVIIGVPGLAETGAVVKIRDHYHCYVAKGGVKPKKVTLIDQFETEKAKIKSPKTFCNPVQKNEGKIRDRKSHLTGYPFKKLQPPTSFLPSAVMIDNQFGSQLLQIKQPKLLLVPTEKNDIQSKLKIDHYKCYTADGDLKPIRVRLKDQFGKTRTRVIRPDLFCNPVRKNKKKIRDPLSHLACYRLKKVPFKRRDIEIDNQFGQRDLRVIRPERLCVPSTKMTPFEIDHFPNSLAQVTAILPTGAQEKVMLTGPTTVRVDILGLADTDGDGREQVRTELVSMNLTGSSSLGPVTVTVRDPTKHPKMRSLGEIEETANTTPGVFDLPPFTQTGSADSFFDVFFEIQVAGMVMHNDDPKRMQTVIDRKPPGPGETYENPDLIPLLDENENDTGWRLGSAYHTPQPPEGQEIDAFPGAQAQLNLTIGAQSDDITVAGTAKYQADLGTMGPVHAGGPDAVPIELISLSLTGTGPMLGDVTLRRRDPTVHPLQPSRGVIQEPQPLDPTGIVNVPPFMATGMAVGFLGVFFEVVVGGQTYHTHEPVQFQATVGRKPAGPGDTYQSLNPVTLFDDTETAVGTIDEVELTPSP